MTRRAERRRRIAAWAGMLVVGGLAAAAAAAAWGTAPAVALLALTLAIAHRCMIAAPGVAILTYHSVSPDPAWLPWSRETAVHPATFAAHLDALRRMGASVIGTRALLAHRAAGEPLPPRAVVLHFDDGYLDNHRHAAPLLRAQGMTATFFPSLDFVAPGQAIRRDGDDAGYMNWAELADLACAFEVEPHGVGHARIATSPRCIGTLTAANWRAHAWLQWAATPGAKHDWFRHALPVAVPLGSAIPESGLALASRGWVDGRREEPAALEARITRDLDRCRAWFAEELGYAPQVFCWPENKVGAEGRRIAAELGYRATTGGKGRNIANEPPHILSRIHVGDRAVGVRCLPLEALALTAQVRLMQGNHYWYLLLAPMNAARRAIFAWRRRFGADFA